MFNLLLTLMVGILIGWNFNAFFSALNAPKIIQNEINLSQSSATEPTEALEQNISEEKRERPKVLSISKPSVKTPIRESETNPFYTLLKQNLFSDAMALYLDARPEEVLRYRTTLKKYFQTKRSENPQEAIREMLEYIELEPEHRSTKIELIETYKDLEEYTKAIQLITELIDTSNDENEKLHSNLLNSSQSYIDLLNNAKNFQELSHFLTERIEQGLQLPFYTYALAKHHINMQRFDLASKLLIELEFDEEYGEKAKNLLLEIEKSQAQEQEYLHKFPLTKEGSHFTIEVSLNNNTPLTLILDTGATITMINEDKLSSLTMVNEHITLQTAGGEIVGQILEADTLNVGDIALQNFQVTTSDYTQEKADGLLGMNFFKEFKFKIDQEENFLYLSEKKAL